MRTPRPDARSKRHPGGAGLNGDRRDLSRTQRACAAAETVKRMIETGKWDPKGGRGKKGADFCTFEKSRDGVAARFKVNHEMIRQAREILDDRKSENAKSSVGKPALDRNAMAERYKVSAGMISMAEQERARFATQFKKGVCPNPAGRKGKAKEQANTESCSPVQRDTKAENARSSVGRRGNRVKTESPGQRQP